MRNVCIKLQQASTAFRYGTAVWPQRHEHLDCELLSKPRRRISHGSKMGRHRAPCIGQGNITQAFVLQLLFLVLGHGLESDYLPQQEPCVTIQLRDCPSVVSLNQRRCIVAALFHVLARVLNIVLPLRQHVVIYDSAWCFSKLSCATQKFKRVCVIRALASGAPTHPTISTQPYAIRVLTPPH